MNKVENNKINQKAPREMKMLMVKPRKHRAKRSIFCPFSPRYEPGKVQTLARCGQDGAPASSQWDITATSAHLHIKER